MSLEIALDCARRGWHVFPCEGKRPLVATGYKVATTDEAQIRGWWRQFPHANPGIATGASGLCVLDVDHGIADGEAAARWMAEKGIPATYTVRTGRRPEFGLQIYFSGADVRSVPWDYGEQSGDVRCSTGYVMAAGSIHPDSGFAYEVFQDEPLAEVPAFVRELRPAKIELAPDAMITERRNLTLTSIAGKLRNDGLSPAALEAALLQTNLDRCEHPLPEEAVKRIAANIGAKPLPEVAPVAVLGSAKREAPKIEDWRELFHSLDEMDNAPPISFLIDGFLQREGVTAIAAPVRERKSFIALNMVRSLLTGEALFGKFPVVKQPERVLYLVPEVSLGPWTDRMRKLGLMGFVGNRLFCRTLSSAHPLSLTDDTLLPALPGCVVFLDTAIRFLEGDENSSQDIRAFADSIFALLRNGAEAVVMLHHSPKDSGDTMTLESAMRGSGDIGAFIASCWGTKLQDPTDPYKSASFISNLKQRDFESSDFEVMCDANGRMHYIEREGKAVLARRGGFKGNQDGMDDTAAALLKTHPKLSLRDSVELLKEHGIKRGKDWVSTKRADQLQESGGKMP